MKTKHLIYCMLAFCLFALSSCGPDNEDYTNKVVGNYDVTITPNLILKYEGSNIPVESGAITTTAKIVKDVDDTGEVTIYIKGVNGFIDDIEFDAYCSSLGMNIEDESYDDYITLPEYGTIDCDIILKNPTVAISNTKVFNWDSTLSGTCKVNYVGLDITCNVSGSLNFSLTPQAQ